MIKLVRVRTKAAIPAVFRGERRIAREMRNLAQWRRDRLSNPKTKALAGGLWSPAKPQLRRETDGGGGGGKCAFCESRGVRFHCDVEHFRPKDTYWWLALCWENYTFSCQICNQVYKKTRFDIKGARWPQPDVKASSTDLELEAMAGTFAPDPLDPAAGGARAAYLDACKKERAGLVHPYDDNPEDYFAWVADPANKEVKPIPGPGGGHKKWMAETTISTLGLDASDLSRDRWRIYTILAGFCAIAQETAPAGGVYEIAMRHINEMTAAEATYAGMCRFFRRKLGL